jgi:thiaminase
LGLLQNEAFRIYILQRLFYGIKNFARFLFNKKLSGQDAHDAEKLALVKK